MSFDWKQMLKKVAPLAGTMIGGPWGGLAMKAIGKVFGHEGVPSEDEAADYIKKATPEQLVALRKLDADLKTRLKELGIKEDELVYQDKANARDMQKEIKSKMPAVLSVFLTVGFFGSLAALIFFTVPDENKGIVYSMVGSLGMCWLASMQFWFGTTKGSSDKNKLLIGK